MQAEIKSPDFAKMSMSELRSYYRSLRSITQVIIGFQCHPLTGGPETEATAWADDMFAVTDQLVAEFLDYLRSVRLAGEDERFRVCMLVEHQAYLADGVKYVVEALGEAIQPLPEAITA